MISNIYGASADFHIIPANKPVCGATFLHVRHVRGSLMTNKLWVCVGEITFHRKRAEGALSCLESVVLWWWSSGAPCPGPTPFKSKHWKIQKTKQPFGCQEYLMQDLDLERFAVEGKCFIDLGLQKKLKRSPWKTLHDNFEWKYVWEKFYVCQVFSSQCLPIFQLQN